MNHQSARFIRMQDVKKMIEVQIPNAFAEKAKKASTKKAPAKKAAAKKK